MGKKNQKISPKRHRFCLEYLKDLNATQAAIRTGYSKKTAGSQGSALLQKPEVLEKIEALKLERVERLKVEADDVLRELLLIAKTDISLAFDGDGNLLPVKDIPEPIRRAIASVQVFEEYQGQGKEREYIGDTVKLKLWDKVRALELLGKHLKLFNDTPERDPTRPVNVEKMVIVFER